MVRHGAQPWLMEVEITSPMNGDIVSIGIVPHEAIDKTCKTYSGPKNDNPCAFPFTFNGTEYNRCIITEDRCGEPWCATENTENAGNLESGSWGYCNHHCPDGQLS